MVDGSATTPVFSGGAPPAGLRLELVVDSASRSHEDGSAPSVGGYSGDPALLRQFWRLTECDSADAKVGCGGPDPES